MWSSELGGYKAPLIGGNIEVINAAYKRAKGVYLRLKDQYGPVCDASERHRFISSG